MPVTDSPIQEPLVAEGRAPQRRAESCTASARPLLTDWLRIALPVLIVAGFMVLAWRYGYFSLKTPAQLDAATDRVEGLPWLAPIFVLIYAALVSCGAARMSGSGQSLARRLDTFSRARPWPARREGCLAAFMTN